MLWMRLDIEAVQLHFRLHLQSPLQVGYILSNPWVDDGLERRDQVCFDALCFS